MPYKNHVKSLVHHLKKVPRRWYIVGGMVLFLGWYGLLFVVKQPVLFSYAEISCAPRVTFLPQLHASPDGAMFTAETRGGVDWLFSTEVCVRPVQGLKKGVAYATIAPFGGWVFRQQYRVEVPPAPVASIQALDKPLSTTRDLHLKLSEPDIVHNYSVQINDKSAKCISKQQMLSCDVAMLKLAQGKKYQAKLVRSFAKEDVTLIEQKVSTLPAVTLKQASVQKDEIVYAKLREFILEMDKPLESVKAELVVVQGGKPAVVKSKYKIQDDRMLHITSKDDLPRNALFELRVFEALARDGSGLDGVVSIPFRTSGGPRPTGVSVRGSDVSPSATATVVFDQEISQAQDITKLIQITGAEIQLSRTANQIHVALQAEKCADITITISKGLLSKYDIPMTENWTHSFRTSCYTTSTIGYSVRGRPITAYHFGNGNDAILFVGGIHGSEASSSLILRDLVDDLNAKARSIPAQRQVVVVPTLNPDGYASGARNNARNVNLNRNFATSDWEKDLQDTNGAVPGGGGETPMSEPETQAIATLSRQLHPRLVLSYHAVGSVVIGNLAGDSTTRAATYASQVGYSVGTGRDAEIFDYAITGTYDDWLAQSLGIPSMIIELGSYTYRDYAHHKTAMWHVIAN